MKTFLALKSVSEWRRPSLGSRTKSWEFGKRIDRQGKDVCASCARQTLNLQHSPSILKSLTKLTWLKLQDSMCPLREPKIAIIAGIWFKRSERCFWCRWCWTQKTRKFVGYSTSTKTDRRVWFFQSKCSSKTRINSLTSSPKSSRKPKMHPKFLTPFAKRETIWRFSCESYKRILRCSSLRSAKTLNNCKDIRPTKTFWSLCWVRKKKKPWLVTKLRREKGTFTKSSWQISCMRMRLVIMPMVAQVVSETRTMEPGITNGVGRTRKIRLVATGIKTWTKMRTTSIPIWKKFFTLTT